MVKIDFKKIKGLEGVSKYFPISVDFLRQVVESVNQSIFYTELKIRKKNPKRRHEFRVVYQAESQLAQFQKNVATGISDIVSFPDYVQGFVVKRSTRGNAGQHLQCQQLLNVDIKNFFDSITLEQVISVFIDLGCDTETSNILARACTLNGVLRQGLHSSPIISNLVVKEMDKDFLVLCKTYNAVYTRYADDMSISSKQNVPTKKEITDILSKYGFELHPDKFRLTKRGEAQYVTGLSVFDSKHPRVPKRIKRQVRLQLYYIKMHGLKDHFERVGVPDFAENYYFNRLRGTIDYINAVEPQLSEKFYKQLPLIPNYGRMAEEMIKHPERAEEIFSRKGIKGIAGLKD